jgi:hypothetical protein
MWGILQRVGGQANSQGKERDERKKIPSSQRSTSPISGPPPPSGIPIPFPGETDQNPIDLSGITLTDIVYFVLKYDPAKTPFPARHGLIAFPRLSSPRRS